MVNGDNLNGQTNDHDSRVAVSRAEFLRLENEAINSPENTWFTGEFVHHPPNHYERLIHWALHGGLEALRNKFVVMK